MPRKKKEKEEIESVQDSIIVDKIIDLLQTACTHTPYSPLDNETHYKKIVETFVKLAHSPATGPVGLIKVALDIALHKRWHLISEPKHVFTSKFNEMTNRDVIQCNICGRFFVDYKTLEDVADNAEKKIAELALMKGYPPKSESEHHCDCHHEK